MKEKYMKQVCYQTAPLNNVIMVSFLKDQLIGVIPEQQKNIDDKKHLNCQDNIAIMFEIDTRVLLSRVALEELELLGLECVLVEGSLL